MFSIVYGAEHGIIPFGLMLTGSTGQRKSNWGWPDIHWRANNQGRVGGTHCETLDRDLL